MNSELQRIFDESEKGTIHFGQVVERLMVLNISAYQVEYRAGSIRLFDKEDHFFELAAAYPEYPIAPAFNGDALRAAIRGAQEGRIKFPEFKRLSQEAGCVGYHVWITGRHVTYYGRAGETHLERFPQ